MSVNKWKQQLLFLLTKLNLVWCISFSFNIHCWSNPARLMITFILWNPYLCLYLNIISLQPACCHYRALEAAPSPVLLCHGEVTGGNIFHGGIMQGLDIWRD